MTALHTRRGFMGNLVALSTLSLLESPVGSNAALGQERETKGRVCVGPEVVQRTLHAMCKVVISSDFGSLSNESKAPKIGSGVLIRTPAALSDLVGDDKMVVLTVSHNFTNTPTNASITLEFFSGNRTKVSRTESLESKVLASDRQFNRLDDVAFLIVDLPRDRLRAESLRSRALDIETNSSFAQFAPVATVGFSGGKCTIIDDLRLLDAPEKGLSLRLTGNVKPGHSGSPLVSSEGRVIGLVSGCEIRPRSIAAGEGLDFYPTWEPLEIKTDVTSEVERALRRYNLQHIPYEVQKSKDRVIGPSAQAIVAFASTVQEAYKTALSTFDTIEEESRRLATQVRSSDLSQDTQAQLLLFIRERLTTKAAATFALVGGTPTSITERIDQFGA